MPKMKTHTGTESRFHVTGTGKLMRTKGGASHLRRNKPGRVKRQYGTKQPVQPVDEKRVRRLLPYGTR